MLGAFSFPHSSPQHFHSTPEYSLKLSVSVINPNTKVNASLYSGTLYSGSVAKLTFIWNKWWLDSADYQIVVNGAMLNKADLQWIDLGNEVLQAVWEGTLHGDTTVEMYAQNVPEDYTRVTVQIESVGGEAQPDPDFIRHGTLPSAGGQGRMTWLQIVIGAGLIMMVPFIMRKELFPEIAESTGLGGPRHKAQKL